MKNIALIGASGFVGSAILNEALERGLHVNAIVRNTGKIKTLHENLKLLQGDVLVEDNVTRLVKGVDAVISAYNPGWTNPNIAEDTRRGYNSIINGVKKAGVGRLLVAGGAGSLFAGQGVRLMDTGAIPESYMPAVRALADVYFKRLVLERELDWIFFSPAQEIVPGKRTGKFRLGVDKLIADDKGASSISVQDYAMAMIDELINGTRHRERMTIGY